MKLDKIADYLEAQGCGKVGKTIFQYEMPAACKEGVLLMNSYYGTPINHYMPGYRAAEFRLVVRGIEMKKAEALALKISAALTIQGETQIPGLLIKQSLPENEPRVYRRSAGAYWELEVDIQCAYVETA